MTNHITIAHMRSISFEKPDHPDQAQAFLASLKDVFKNHSIEHKSLGNHFEQNLAQYCGSMYAVSSEARSGAIRSLLRFFGFKSNDQIICSPMTSSSIIASIIDMNLIPVFADICDPSMEMDIKHVEKLIDPKTKGVLYSYPYAYPQNIEPFIDLCRQHRLTLIENVEGGPGSFYNSKHLGTNSHAGILKFHPKSILNINKGGVIITDDDRLTQHLRNPNANAFDHLVRISQMHAAIGLWTMDHQVEALKRKEDICKRYDEVFSQSPEVMIKRHGPHEQYNHDHYVVRLSESLKSKLMYALNLAGIQTHNPMEPAHLNSFVQIKLRPEHLLNAEKLYCETFLLPVYPALSSHDVDYICQTIERNL